MLFTFFRGYTKLNGTDEMRLSHVAHRYIITWFLFDFLLIALDIFMLMLEDPSWMKYATFLRLLRLLRLLRVLRLLKMQSRIAMLAQVIQFVRHGQFTDKGAVFFQILRNLAAIVLINHFTACCWYAVGTLDENGWVWEHLEKKDRVGDNQLDKIYLYLTAFHWSVSQFTPGSNEITATTSLERLFNICIILVGLCLFSSFISSMTQQMTQLQVLSRKTQTRMQNLRRFMSEHKISITLASTIAQFVQQKRAPDSLRGLKLKDIELFETFPEILLSKIRIESYDFIVRGHGLFSFIRESGDHAFSDLCKRGMFESSINKGHDVFHSGQEGTGMYFLIYGCVGYAYGGGISSRHEDVDDWLDLHDHRFSTSELKHAKCRISEMSLFLQWTHQGRLYGSDAVSDLLFIDAKVFRRVANDSLLLWQEMRRYANLYALTLNRVASSDKVVDDLWDDVGVIKAVARLALQGGLTSSLSQIAEQPELTLKVAFRAWKAHTATRLALSRWWKKFCRLMHQSSGS